MSARCDTPVFCLFIHRPAASLAPLTPTSPSLPPLHCLDVLRLRVLRTNLIQLHVHKQRASAGTVVAVRVFVVYSNPGETAVAIQKMHGRFFAGRQVQAAAYDEGLFVQGALDN